VSGGKEPPCTVGNSGRYVLWLLAESGMHANVDLTHEIAVIVDYNKLNEKVIVAGVKFTETFVF
jgi:hypothetical protein